MLQLQDGDTKACTGVEVSTEEVQMSSTGVTHGSGEEDPPAPSMYHQQKVGCWQEWWKTTLGEEDNLREQRQKLSKEMVYAAGHYGKFHNFFF